jgi:hypothetical protein
VLVSDGGATLDPQPYLPLRPWRRYGRYVGLANSQGSSVRKRWLISSYKANPLGRAPHEGTYFGIGSDLGHDPKQPDERYPQQLVDDLISEVRTDLARSHSSEAPSAHRAERARVAKLARAVSRYSRAARTARA